MANEIPSNIDPASEIEVLLAGNIADDDMMWVVRCPASELSRLVLAPREWVAALGDLPGWLYYGTGERAPTPSLTRDFAMGVQTAPVPDPLGRIVVQGISGTNVLNVVASPGGAQDALRAMGLAASADDPFQAFWNALGSDPNNPPTLRKALPINVVSAISTLFGHFEILDREETPEQRAARTATFLLAATLDPKGYSAMLNGLDQRITVVGQGGSTVPLERVVFPTADPRVFYGNVEGEPSDADPIDDGNTCGTIVMPNPDDPTWPPITTVKRWKHRES